MKRNLLFALALSASLASQAQVPNFTALDMNLDTRYDGDGNALGFPEAFAMGNVIMVDYNNDGWLDITMKGRGYWTDPETAIIKNNQGTFSLDNDVVGAFPGGDYHGAFRAIDFNNDGNVDFVMAAEGSWKLWKNTGAGFEIVESFTAEAANLARTEHEVHYGDMFYVADMNNDGNQDIVTFLAETEETSRNVVILEGDGAGSFTQNVISGSALGGNSALAVGDIDGDGYKDVLITGWGEGGTAMNVLMSDGTGMYEICPQGVIGIEKGYANLVDLNADGKLDLIFSGETYTGDWGKSFNLSINTGERMYPFDESEELLDAGYNSGNDWADMNGDGTVDALLACNGYAEIGIFTNDGTGKLKKTRGYMNEGARGCACIATGDLNNDGFLDVIAMGYTESGKNFKVYQNKGEDQNGIAKNVAPAAPANVAVKAEEGNLVFSWDKAEGALLYNVYVETVDGEIITVIPADPKTGFIKVSDLNAGINSTSYVLKGMSLENIKSWGVQSISAGKAASAFAAGPTTGISEVANGDANGVKEFFTIDGRRMSTPANGIYLERQGNKVTKVIR